MRGFGEIARLCRRRPRRPIGVVTSVGAGPRRAGRWDRRRGPRQGRADRGAPGDGTAILNADDPRVRGDGRTHHRRRAARSATSGDADVRVEQIAPRRPGPGDASRSTRRGVPTRSRLAVSGRHMAIERRARRRRRRAVRRPAVRRRRPRSPGPRCRPARMRVHHRGERRDRGQRRLQRQPDLDARRPRRPRRDRRPPPRRRARRDGRARRAAGGPPRDRRTRRRPRHRADRRRHRPLRHRAGRRTRPRRSVRSRRGRPCS